MKASHLVLGAMAAIVALIGIVALAGPPVLRMMAGGGGDGPITIAIATPSMLSTLQGQADRQHDEAQGAQHPTANNDAAAPRAANTPPLPAGSSHAGVDQGSAHAATPAPELDLSQQVALLRQSSADGLGNELAGRLVGSGRFVVKDSSQFLHALGSMRNRANQPASSSGGFLQSFRFWERNNTQSSNTANGTSTTSERSGGQTLERISGLGQDDFRGAGEQLDANYIVIIGLEDGAFSPGDDADSAEDNSYIINWEPVLQYRVFNVHDGNVVYGTEIILSPIPIRISRNMSLADQRISASRQMDVGLDDRVATVITQKLIALLVPPRIGSGADGLTVDRGSADGIAIGDVYSVERGAAGGPRTAIGQVRVTAVSANSATVQAVQGNVRRNDIVVIRRTGASAGAVGSNTAVSSSGDVLSDAERAMQDKPALAVGEMRVEYLEPEIWRLPASSVLPVTRGIADALVQSGQVQVLNRDDLARLQRERELSARAQGDDGADPSAGLATAGHLLTGEVEISASQTGDSISVGGQSRVTHTGWHMLATGSLRIQTLDGRTVASVQVRTERPGSPQDRVAVNALIDAFSADAAAAVMVRLSPIQIVSFSASGVSLNRGPEAGLREGTRLRAYAVNPSTRTRQVLGDLIVTDASAGYNASARFAGTPFSQPAGGNVVVEVVSGVAAPSTRPRPQQQSQPESTVHWN